MSIAVLLILFAAVAGSTVLAATLTWLALRSRGRDLGAGAPNAFALEEQVRRLSDELDGANQQIELLRERMDFTERLLGSGDDAGS